MWEGAVDYFRCSDNSKFSAFQESVAVRGLGFFDR